jgi:hypothetical protein
MALDTLLPAQLLSAIATDVLVDTTLSEAPLLGMLAANGIYQQQRNIEWGAKVGAAAVSGRAIGGSLADDTNGVVAGAALSIPDYYFKHQFTVIKRDLVNAATTGKITAVRNPIRLAVADAIKEITRKINGVLYTGNGTADTTHFGVIGLNTAAVQTGNYAGISRTTYSKWRSILNQGAVPGTLENLTVDRLNAVLRSRRAAGAVDRFTPGNELVIICNDEVENDVLRKLYSSAADETSLYEMLNKDVSPFVRYFVRGIPVVSDVDVPANSMYLLNMSKLGLYSFDDRESNANNPRVAYFPLRVEGFEDSTIYIRLADVSLNHPDVLNMELSVSIQLAVWDLKDGLTKMEDVRNNIV